MEQEQTIQEILKTIIKRSGKTLTEVSRMRGKDASNLHRLLRDGAFPSSALVAEVLDLLGFEIFIKRKPKGLI